MRGLSWAAIAFSYSVLPFAMNSGFRPETGYLLRSSTEEFRSRIANSARLLAPYCDFRGFDFLVVDGGGVTFFGKGTLIVTLGIALSLSLACAGMSAIAPASLDQG